MTGITNLDYEAATVSQEIIKNAKSLRVDPKPFKASDLENAATKTLGVVQECGVYAGLLFLFSQSSNQEYFKAIANQLLKSPSVLKTLGQDFDQPWDNVERVLESVSEKICSDMDALFFVKQLWEQTLIYARYAAKAVGGAD